MASYEIYEMNWLFFLHFVNLGKQNTENIFKIW